MTAGGLDLEAQHPQLMLAPDGFCSGKIQDSDVVDVANYTLEQDELQHLTGSGRSYAAVVTAGKKNDLRRPRRRNGRVAEGLLDSRRENHDYCRITRREFDKQDLAMCEGKRTYAGGTLGKPKGFGRRYVGAISPLN